MNSHFAKIYHIAEILLLILTISPSLLFHIHSHFFLVIISDKINFHSIHVHCPNSLLLKCICNRYTSSRNTDRYIVPPLDHHFSHCTHPYISPLEYGKYPPTAKLPATINSIKTFVNQSSYTQTPLRISYLPLQSAPNKTFPFQLLNHKQPTVRFQSSFLRKIRIPQTNRSLPLFLPNCLLLFETSVYWCTVKRSRSKGIGRC